jgi:hypothetical protein
MLMALRDVGMPRAWFHENGPATGLKYTTELGEHLSIIVHVMRVS